MFRRGYRRVLRRNKTYLLLIVLPMALLCEVQPVHAQSGPPAWTTYTTRHGLASNAVSSIAVDSDGHVWVGTFGGGVSRFDGQEWFTYSTGHGLADDWGMRRKVYPGDVPWTVVKERRSGFYSDVKKVDFLTCEVERPGDTPRPRFVEREGIKSAAALLLPFRAAESKDEEVVGAMFVNYRTHHDFNIDEIAALATFADYAAVAVLNARHEQRRRAEQMRIAESISANFAHRMSNLAGTSRVAAQLLRERIDPADNLSLRQLARIERESNILLDLAERIAHPFKETGRMFELIPIDIAKILGEELDRIKSDLGVI